MFYQEEEIIERLRYEENIQLQLGVSISNIGISVMDQEGRKRVELIYITLKNVEYMMHETSNLRTSQLKIKYLNIDNNSNYETMFPVILTPTKYNVMCAILIYSNNLNRKFSNLIGLNCLQLSNNQSKFRRYRLLNPSGRAYRLLRSDLLQKYLNIYTVSLKASRNNSKATCQLICFLLSMISSLQQMEKGRN